ncbi:hypothetical protein KIK06_07235 [Nocardiopsis sp. EMB25]|uniref:hypothetical protein n=1 Tax=Nocardiopsis TaxID=2013 RepID=UPI00036319EB|nr:MULTISPECIES: hypothetical protein [Nocardiopsis]MCY9783684.1 hypothetical protein [Nocardiopsis sp. EMB25]
MDTDRHRWRNEDLARAMNAISTEIEAAWTDLCRTWDVVPGTPEETDLVRLVTETPDQFPWRIVDAALDRRTCPRCARPLGSGERGCDPCDTADGYRYAAREPDRPGVPPGNEHAVRVAWAVSRSPHRHSRRAACGFELGLPLLYAGELPTTEQAQRLRHLVNRLTEDECARVASVDELLALAGRRA